MPAYFNIALVFERKDIRSNFTRDIHNLLHKAGFIFQSGCFEAEKYSLEEILCYNQKHLETNYHLGYTEHCSNDYKQMYYKYGEFSEVRGFWMNNYPEDDEKFGYSYKVKEIQMLINSCKVLWNDSLVKMIQTGLENCDEVVSLIDIQAGALPNTYPFAIVPNELTQKLSKVFCVEKIDYRGILIHRTFNNPVH